MAVASFVSTFISTSRHSFLLFYNKRIEPKDLSLWYRCGRTWHDINCLHFELFSLLLIIPATFEEGDIVFLRAGVQLYGSKVLSKKLNLLLVT